MIKWAVFALFFVSFVAADCDNACQAYVWGYPLWQSVNNRFVNFMNQPTFTLNTIVARVSQPPAPPPAIPQLALCNATLCAGQAKPPLNPSPVIGPNVDTIYGSFSWDLGPLNDPVNPDGGALKFTMPPLATRYASVILYDHYTNVLLEYSSVNQQQNGQGGAKRTFCLTQVATHAACAGLNEVVVLPRFGFAIIRVFSSGDPSPPCGVDGCIYLLQILQNFTVLAQPASTKSYVQTYGAFMAPNPAGTTCPYVYTEPPCGNNGNKSAFWQAICQAITDNPLSGNEAAYVDNTFGQYGIGSTGCNPTVLAASFATLNAGFSQGYDYVKAHIEDTGSVQGPWYFYNFLGQWNVQNSQASLQRAVAATRAIYINSNTQAAYWISSKDSNLNFLSAAWGTTYKIVWQSTQPFAAPLRGFWSVTVYDSTGFLYIPPEGTDQRQYAVRGIDTTVPSEIHISNVCKSPTNCLRANPGFFGLAFRVYAPLANILPGGGYPLPQIIKCDCNSPCN
jgi:hypothetical protein